MVYVEFLGVSRAHGVVASLSSASLLIMKKGWRGEGPRLNEPYEIDEAIRCYVLGTYFRLGPGYVTWSGHAPSLR